MHVRIVPAAEILFTPAASAAPSASQPARHHASTAASEREEKSDGNFAGAALRNGKDAFSPP